MAAKAFDSCIVGVSSRERRQADLFWADLVGPPRRSSFLPPIQTDTLDEAEWVESVSQLPEHYQLACQLARQAEEELDPETVEALTYELLGVQDQDDLEEFLGKLVNSVKHTVEKTVSDVRRTKLAQTLEKTVSDAARTKLARSVAKAAGDIGKGLEKVGTAVPAVATIIKLASRATPLGALARSTYGALAAAMQGKNIAMGALDGLAGTPVLAAVVQVAGGVLRGQDVLTAAKMAAKAGISDAREALRLAAMVAPFVPGVGTGVGAALGAADALANGQPITQALIAGVRGSVPGGAIAQAAFDTGTALIQGKRLDQALLAAARNRLPPGPAQAAFDTGLAVAQGKKLQDAALQAAGGLLPASPYSADIQTFAKRALAGDNLANAALSTAGNAVLRRVKQQGGDLVAAVQGKLAAVQGQAATAVQGKVAAVQGQVVSAIQARVGAAAPTSSGSAPRKPGTFEQAISAIDLAERRGAGRFFADLTGKAAAQPSATAGR